MNIYKNCDIAKPEYVEFYERVIPQSVQESKKIKYLNIEGPEYE